MESLAGTNNSRSVPTRPTSHPMARPRALLPHLEGARPEQAVFALEAASTARDMLPMWLSPGPVPRLLSGGQGHKKTATAYPGRSSSSRPLKVIIEDLALHFDSCTEMSSIRPATQGRPNKRDLERFARAWQTFPETPGILRTQQGSPCPFVRLPSTRTNPSISGRVFWRRFYTLVASVAQVCYSEGLEVPIKITTYKGTPRRRRPPDKPGLLPNVTIVKVSCLGDDSAKVAPFLFSSSLRTMKLEFGSGVSATALLLCLSCATASHASLEGFSLTGDSCTTVQTERHKVSEAVSALLKNTPTLKKVELQLEHFIPSLLFRSDVVDSLSEMPHLQQMVIRSSSGAPQYGLLRDLEPRHDAFPSLLKLRIPGPLSECAHAVECMSPKLTAIRFDSPGLQYSTELPRSIERVVSFCTSLSKLTISVDSIHPNELAAWLDLSPLLACTNLEYVDFRHPSPLPLADDHIEDMCLAWPRLRHLSLNPRPRPDLADSYEGVILTLGSLIIAVRFAPHLEHLGLFLDPDLDPAYEDTAAYEDPNAKISRSDLRTLDLGSTRSYVPGRERGVARFIRELFYDVLVVERRGCSAWVQLLAGIVALTGPVQ